MPASHLEQRFSRYWALYSTYPLETQYTDDNIRGKRNKLPFDFRVTGTNVLIEINGATHRPGTGHTSASGTKRDAVKSNMALYEGYLPFTFTNAMITHEKVKELAAFIDRVYGIYTLGDKRDEVRQKLTSKPTVNKATSRRRGNKRAGS